MPKPKINLASASNAELATFYKVSLSTIKAWQRKGYPVRDFKRLQTALDAQRSAAEITPGTPLSAARLAKVVAETEKIRFELETQRGLWTRNDEMTRISTAWAARVRAEFMSLIPELPTLAGLDAATLEERGKQFVNGALSRLQTFST